MAGESTNSRLTSVQIRLQNNQFTEEIPISVLASNIIYDPGGGNVSGGVNQGYSLVETLGNVNMNTLTGGGSLQSQIDNLRSGLNSHSNTLNDIPNTISTWLSQNCTFDNSKITGLDTRLQTAGLAADAKAAGDLIKVSNSQPDELSNKIWIKPSVTSVSVPTMQDIENIVAPQYNSQSPYSVGDYVIHNDLLYRCTTTIGSSGESWTSGHWTQINIGNQLKTTKNTITDLVDDTLSVTGKAADAAKTGEELSNLKSDILDLSEDVSVIPDNTDYDTLTTIGTYRVNDITHAATMIHSPNIGAHKLVVLKTTQSNKIYQIAVRAGRNEIYIRAKDGSGDWTAWDRQAMVSNLATSVDLKYDNRSTALTSGTDYDNVGTGSYYCGSSSLAQSMINCPVTVGHRFFVFETYNANDHAQLVITNRKIFFRYSGESWKEVITSDYLASKIDLKYNSDSSTIANGTDYDTIGTGTYVCNSMSSAQSMINCPVTVGHRMFVFETYNASDFVQILMANREIYYRYRGESWKKYAIYKPEIPEYYNAHMTRKEEKINTTISDVGFYGDSFGIVTDTHWGRNAKNSPDLIKHISLHTPVNRLMLLGDYYITQSTESGALKAMNESLGSFKDKGMLLHIIPGNHDYNKGTISGYPVLTESQVYGQLITGQYDIVCDDDTCSFWFDNKQKKIRYYFTTCMYNSTYNSDSYKWVFSQMEELPNGYNFVIFTHTGLSGSLSTSHEYSDILTGAMAAVRDKNTYTFDGSTFDYSNVNANPMFIIGGHNHSDNVFTYNGIACVQLTTDAYYYEEGGLTREQGTETEQAFDIGTVDIHNAVLYLTRIGAGYDRIIHFNMITVSSPVTLTSKLSGTLIWNTSNSSIASVSGGVVTKTGTGYCVISSTDVNGLSEYWVVKC